MRGRQSPVAAAVLAAVAVLATGWSAGAEDGTETTAAAAKAFARGSALFKKRDYVGAIEAFEEAYRSRPHFMVQCNIARCYEWSGDFVRAAPRYRRCLDEGARGSEAGERAQASLQEAEARISWLKVESPGAGGTIYVDGRPAGPAPGRVAINPGTHAVEVRRPNATPATATLATRGGEERRVSLAPIEVAPRVVLEPPRVTPRSRLRPVWFWVTAATTVALAAAATGMGIATLSARSSFEEHPTEDSYQTAVNRRLVTNVLWGVTVAAAGASTGLFFYTDFRGETAAGPVEVSLGVRGWF